MNASIEVPIVKFQTFAMASLHICFVSSIRISLIEFSCLFAPVYMHATYLGVAHDAYTKQKWNGKAKQK